MADIAYEVENGVYKIENSAIQRAFQISGLQVTSVLNGDTATMTLNEDIDDDGVPENTQEFSLTGGTESFSLAGYEVKQDNEIWLTFDFTDDGNIEDAGRIEDVTFKPETFALGLTEITNYLEDDWNDNRLTDREWRDTDINQGVFAHPDANEAGDTLIGRYRPEWNASHPSDTTVSGGVLTVSKDSADGNQTVSTPSNITSGTSQCDISIDSDQAAHRAYFVFMGVDRVGSIDPYSDNGYYMKKNAPSASSNDDLSVITGGSATTLINGPPTTLTEKTYQATRDSYGSLEFIVDSVSQGTATDTTHSESNWVNLTISGSSDSYSVTYDNLVVK